jgi:3-hydroxymyristoyl/3-hydroxydecanoyl-(acyl carrier protein) dehydratase
MSTKTAPRSGVERRLLVSDDLVFLQGHFEGFPVVAGVVQLRWVMSVLEELIGEKAQGGVLEALKFPTPLLPGGSISVEVADAGDFFRFRVHEGGRTFASGRWRPGTD